MCYPKVDGQAVSTFNLFDSLRHSMTEPGSYNGDAFLGAGLDLSFGVYSQLDSMDGGGKAKH